MNSLSKDLVFLILQFLDENGYKETVNKLEQESGYFFNMRHFSDLVTKGNWDEVERYLSGFTNVADNSHSTKIFFEIRKQKYLEALDRRDRSRAVDILVRDLKVFSTHNEDLFKEITQLLTLENFRANERLSGYVDTKSARSNLLAELKKLIEDDPVFHDKLRFPTLKNSRLQALINQGLNWQHQFCENPRPNPEIETLFTDHSCGKSTGVAAQFPLTYSLMGTVPRPGSLRHLSAHSPLQPAPAAALPSSPAAWLASPSSAFHPVQSAGRLGLAPPSSAAVLKRPRIPPANSPSMDYQTADPEFASKRSRPCRISDENTDSRSLVEVKPRLADESLEKSRMWKMTEISEQSQCRAFRLPDNLTATRVCRLIYTNSGNAILSLASNAVHQLWKWHSNEGVLMKATASIAPQQWKPKSGILMTNDINDSSAGAAVPCFALTKNDSYVMSASGGKITLFNMNTFKAITTFMSPPPAATSLAFHPQDNNIIAIGMDDSTVQIYNVQVGEVKTVLIGHQKRITGLAFSKVLNVLVSSGADSQLCVWSMDRWEKQASSFMPIPAGRAAAPLADAGVQFHMDHIHLLAVNETQIAIYEAPKLECLEQWVPREASGSITDATYSCDSQLIYVCFEDGSVGVLTSSMLRWRCRINQAAYLPLNSRVYPLVIAAHPSEAEQFALGLTDGGVYVFEPLESEGKWGTTSPPLEDSVGPSTAAGAASTDQPQS